MMKATKSVREVMVMPMPALARVTPTRRGTFMSFSPRVSLHDDISKNMSSIPIPAADKSFKANIWKELKNHHNIYFFFYKQEISTTATPPQYKNTNTTILY